MWKKPSKFKNTFPEVPKREECIHDLPISTSNSSNNGVKCNFNLLAFEIDGEGGKLGVLPLNSKGRKLRQDLTIVCAHSDKVADFQFSNFGSKNLLVTCAKDESVKLFDIEQTQIDSQTSFSLPAGQISNLPISEKQSTTPDFSCLAFHSTAENILAVSNANLVHICDLHKLLPILTIDQLNGKISSISWKNDGRLLAALDRSQNLSVIDLRNKGNTLSGTVNCHSGIGRENRVLYLGDQSTILTSGFTKQKVREISLFDDRNFSKPLHNMQFEPSTGILMPFYDDDANLLFLAGKGSTKVHLFEFTKKEPYLAEGMPYTSTEQTYGACLVPKICLNVMQTEVDRLIQVSKNKLTPICYKVPRKTFRDFHPDLYPSTVGKVPGLSSDDWFNGENKNPPKFDLNPSKRHFIENGMVEMVDNQQDMNHSISNGNNNNMTSSSNGVSEKFDYHVTTTNRHVITIGHDKNNATSHVTASKDHVIDHVLKKQHVDKHVKDHVTTMDRYKSSSHVTGEDHVDKYHRSSAGAGRSISHVTLLDDQHVHVSSGHPPVAKRAGHAGHVMDKINRFSWHPSAASDNDRDTVGSSDNTSRRDSHVIPPTSKTAEDHVTVDKDSFKMQRSNTLFPGLRPSKFRHVTVANNGNNVLYTNLRHVNTRLPIESDGFCANAKFAAIPLSGAGGPVAILDVRKKGKLPDDKIPAIENGALVNDLQFSPFHDDYLAIACDNGYLNIWRIPDNGLSQENLPVEPERTIKAHDDKLIFVRFNPVAEHLLATCDKSGCLKIWNLSTSETASEFQTLELLESHPQKLSIELNLNVTLICLCWNVHGNLLGCVDKCANLLVFDPRHPEHRMEKPNVVQSTKAARILFACNDEMLLISSFSKSSDRTISLYNAISLDLLCTKSIDVSPQLLIPYYDFDTSVVFLTGKGDRTIYTYEISRRDPYLLELTPFRDPNAHQSISLAPKFLCNVANVEIANGFRLKLTDLEKISFTVPRRKMELFQNDIFVDALISWAPVESASDWLANRPVTLKYQSLKPDCMELLYPDVLTNKYSPDENNTIPSYPIIPETAKIPGKSNIPEKSTVKDLPLENTNLTEKYANFPVQNLQFDKSPTLNENLLLNNTLDNIAQNKMMQIAEVMGKRMDMLDVKELEQDKMEGVDEKEWC